MEGGFFCGSQEEENKMWDKKKWKVARVKRQLAWLSLNFFLFFSFLALSFSLLMRPQSDPTIEKSW